MASKMDFASLLEDKQSPAREKRKLRRGESVEGTIVQIGDDSIFVDIGFTVEARVDRASFEAKDGTLTVSVGDRIRATVANVYDTGPELVTSLGKATVDVSALIDAMEAKLPVLGKVARAVKGGVEVVVGGSRAFCPASQLGGGFIADLESLVGQEMEFQIIEVREGGKSIVLSRKALLKGQEAALGKARLASLSVGTDHDGKVTSVKKYGAFIDVGGVEGLVHISEISGTRIERVEDVLNVGDEVKVRILALEPGAEGEARIRLSIKALQGGSTVDAPKHQEVLDGTVEKLMDAGILVATAKGSGFVPKRELGLGHSTDMRRAYPVGKEVRVVVLNRDDKSGRMSFSIRSVADVEERQNYAQFVGQSKGTQNPASPQGGAGFGSFGELFAKRLGVAPPSRVANPAAASRPAPVPAATSVAAPSPDAAPKETQRSPRFSELAGVSPSPAPVASEPRPAPPPSRDRNDESRIGVVRGRKKDR